jgi:hypothetical protein
MLIQTLCLGTPLPEVKNLPIACIFYVVEHSYYNCLDIVVKVQGVPDSKKCPTVFSCPSHSTIYSKILLRKEYDRRKECGSKYPTRGYRITSLFLPDL